MPPNPILAIPTYGSQRVKSPRTNQIVSAYKLGYTTASRDVLLALYGNGAEDVTSKHASYHYVQLHKDVVMRHGYLLNQVSHLDLLRVEAITRKHPSPRIYHWQDGTWSELPSARKPDYTPITIRGMGPDFNPSKLFSITETSATNITIEKSQRGSETPWWWLRGDTYPHRELLKSHGCRWSKRNKAWYFIGETVPKAVEDLASPEDEPPPSAPAILTDDAPCSPQEAEQILGVKLNIPDVNPMKHRHAMPTLELGQQIWSAHEMTITPTEVIPMGTEGKITARYVPDREEAYIVDFGKYGVHTVFGKNISSYNSFVKGITRKETIELLNSGPPEDPYKVARERRQTIPNRFTLLDQLPREEIPKTTPAQEDTHPQETPTTQEDTIPEEETTQHIRIIEPAQLPEHLQTAIESARSAPPVHRSPTTTHKQQRIGQAFCGELSGDITGNVQCFGYAIHEGVLIYLNMGGPKMACEAIRAKLSKAQAVNLHFDDAPSIELTPGENNTGMYEAFGQYIKEARYTSMILVHEMVIEPNYGGKSTTFIFRTSEEQLIAKLKHHITELVNVPVFDEWASYLWQAGQSAMLVRKTRGGGDVDLWTVDLDADAWSRLITGSLENGVIALQVNPKRTFG